jgi:ATP-dependent exoDNAse (exonuclease V) beta subunit
MEYNKKKHLKLLKSSPKLESLRTGLTDEKFVKFLDFMPIADENFFELQEYSAMMISHLHWENREHYFELIEKLLNGPMDFLELRKKHRAINDVVESLEAKLILLEPNKRCAGFDDLIDELVSLFDRYCPDPSLRESHELRQEELRNLVQKIFIEMKERYPENSKDNV